MPAPRRSSKLKPTVAHHPQKHWQDRVWRPGVILAAMAVSVLFFYAEPLFDNHASIQWDTADLHYSFQRAISDGLWSGKVPFWTPYEYSGMPLAADPQAGAWYPLNWPFFLAGITPRALEWEIALHALLACFGTWLLARELVRSQTAALMAALCYGFSGFFAAHSSHLGMFQAAALFPWLLWAYRRGENSGNLLYAAAAGAIGGCIVLAGHFQTALYCFAGLVLFAAAGMVLGRKTSLVRGAVVLGVAGALTLALSAVEVLPGLELTAQSIRASADYSKQTNASLPPGALLTLVSPDHFGAARGPYNGPDDITQYYYYAGILTPLLALTGLALYAGIRPYALALAAPALWYAFGPSAGFYRLVAVLPGFRNIRAPVHAWFVVALALALCAGAGLTALSTRVRQWWIPLVLLLFTFGDLWYWNMDQNQLAFVRSSWQQLYGDAYVNFVRATAGIRSRPLHRLWSKFDLASFGQLSGMLDSQTETTYGYNPLELSRYADYIEAANSNPELLNSLAVTFRIDPSNGALLPNAAALSRAYFPKTVQQTGSDAATRARLATLRPAEEVLASVLPPGLAQDPHATAQITAYQGDRYDIRYTAAARSILRLAVPYYPGWRAEVDGRQLPVVPVDEALSGIVVPAGTHDLVFQYHPNWFFTGAGLSVLGWLALAVIFTVSRLNSRRRRELRPTPG